MYRFVSDQQIASARLPLLDVYDLVVEGFGLHGRGEFELPPKQGVHPRSGALMHAMPVYLPTKDLVGTKLISVFPDNVAKGIPAAAGIITMMNPDTGVVTGIVDAAWITNMRTAMVSMVDTKYLANPDPVFGIVGATGGCGRAHVEAIAEIFPGSQVIVNSRSREKCEELVAEYESLPIDLVIQMDQEAVVKESDVLIGSTSTLSAPIYKTEWLHPGLNVLNVHTQGWPADITDHVDLVSCDNRGQIVDINNGLTGTYPGLDPDFELGEVVVGTHLGRENAQQTIFSFNYGLATFDVLVADYVLKVL